MIWLVISEFSLYRSTDTVNHLKVDDQQQHGGEQFWLDLSIGLHSQRCDTVQVSLRDTKGHEVNIADRVRTSAWIPPYLLISDPAWRTVRTDDAPGCLVVVRTNVPKVRGARGG